MATIDIYPGAPNSGTTYPGGGYTTANAAAYGALSGTVLNTIRVRGGYRYALHPGETGWWGITSKWGLDKPVDVQVDSSYGSDTAIFDCWTRYEPNDLTGTWDGASGLWYIDVYNSGNASYVEKVFFGASSGNTLATIDFGIQYPAATGGTFAALVANCNADGLSTVQQLSGKGIWFSVTSDFNSNELGFGAGLCRLYIWTPLGFAGGPPAVQWGGLAINAAQTSGNGGTPRYGPFVVGINSGSGTNNPSGTLVREGFVFMGANTNLIGGHRYQDHFASVSNVTYRDVRGYSAQNLILVDSDVAGSTLSNFRLEGFEYDDLILPDYFAASANSGGGEVVSVGMRAKTFFAGDGKAVCGATHGVVNFGISVDAIDGIDRDTGAFTAEMVSDDVVARRIEGYIRSGSRDARALSVVSCLRGEVHGCRFIGANTRSHIAGQNTLISQNEMALQGPALADPVSGKSCMDLRVNLDTTPANVSVRVYRNIFDTRGDSTRGRDGYAAIEVRSSSSHPLGGAANVPAGALDARANVFLSDGDVAPLWFSHSSGATISTNQTWLGNFHNLTTGTEARETTAPGTGAGSRLSVASLLATGTVNAGTIDTDGNRILRRGDRPTVRPLELALPT